MNLENKLQTADLEMNKIVNARVFSGGNNLIYELDVTARQLRMLKDHIFFMEKNLTEKIRLCYDRELDRAKIKVADYNKQFQEYQDKVYAKIDSMVSEETNNIRDTMKKKEAYYTRDPADFSK